MQVVTENDEMKDFSSLAEKSFGFWNSAKDDVYQEYYEKNAVISEVFTKFKEQF